VTLETIEAAITAAETGHLVFCTMHTTGSAPTVDRLIEAFPPQQQEQIRVNFPSPVGGHSQLLQPKKDGTGRDARSR